MGMKKMAAVLLAVVMMLCLLPTAAFAAGTYLVYLNGAWLDAGETDGRRRQSHVGCGKQDADDRERRADGFCFF